MTILFEEKNMEIDETIGTIESLCAFLKIDKESGMAISVNGLIIPRLKWNDIKLGSGDKIILIKASQGG